MYFAKRMYLLRVKRYEYFINVRKTFFQVEWNDFNFNKRFLCDCVSLTLSEGWAKHTYFIVETNHGLMRINGYFKAFTL